MKKLIFALAYLSFILPWVCFSANPKVEHGGIYSRGAVLVDIDGSAGVEASTNASVDLKDSDKYLLPNRMTTAQRDAITNPEQGAQIYNTTTELLNYYDSSGAEWKEVGDVDLTASRVLVSDGSGDISSSTTTSTELGYLDATSSIQTQINAKQDDVIAAQGSIAVGGAGGSAEELTLGTNGQVVVSNGTTLVFDDATAGATSETVIGVNYFTNNSGFELSDDTGWNATTLTDAYESTGTVIENTYSVELNPSGADETFISDAITLPPLLIGEDGKNLVGCLAWSGTDGDNWNFIIKDDSANTLLTETLEVTTDGKSKNKCYNFSSSGTTASLTFELHSIDAGDDTRFDSFMLGLAEHVNLNQISQAEIYGTAVIDINANAVITGNVTGTMTTFTDTDITSGERSNTGSLINPSTVGDIAAAAANLPPSKYEVTFVVPLQAYDGGNDGTTTTCQFQIYDGTNFSGQAYIQAGDADADADAGNMTTLTGVFEYSTTQSSIEWSLQYDNLTGTSCRYLGSQTTGLVIVKKFPLSSQTAYTANTTPILAQAYHGNACNFYTASTSLVLDAGDASCVFSQNIDNNLTMSAVADGTGNQAATGFTPTKTGTYEIEVSFNATNTTASKYHTYALTDGTTTIDSVSIRNDGVANGVVQVRLKGLLPITSLAAIQLEIRQAAEATSESRIGALTGLASYNIHWVIKDVSQNFPMPQILEMYEYVWFKDIKASGTDGGTFTQDAWQTRTLNTTENTKSWASLNANQFTLQAGKYKIKADVPALAVGSHQSRLYNISDAALILTGTSTYSPNGTDVQNNSPLRGIFTITSEKVFEIQHYCDITRTSYGYGLKTSYGEEIYTQVEIQKIGN